LAGVITGCGGKEVIQPPPPAQAPVVQVLTPNGGESFRAGAQTEITWTATDGDTPMLLISVEFSPDGGAVWLPVAVDDPNDGTFTWAVPGMATGQALIRVTATDGVHRGSDVSDNPFSISSMPPPPPQTPVVHVLTPNGGESFLAGSQTGITWTATDGDTQVLLITIELSPDGGAVWLPVAVDEPNDGTFTWAVPGTATGQALIRVTATDGVHLGSDVSDNPFSITATPPPDTPETLTAKGWTAFEAGDFAQALQRFGAAIALDAQYGPAYTGRGWVELTRATTTDAFRAAVTTFDAAVARGQTSADARGGRAAAKLALGGSDLAGAVQEAQAAVAASPTFVFPHRTSFDYRDLHLIAAFAEAGRGGRFSAARDEADQVQASGIRLGDPQTWIVDDLRYPTFEAAVLAWLHKMSAAFAG
jgi:hypothetical protein